MKCLTNLEGVRLGKTLGVPHFTLNTMAAMRKQFAAQFICQVSLESVPDYEMLPDMCHFVYSNEPGFPRVLSAKNRPMYIARRIYERSYRFVRRPTTAMFRQDCVLEFSPHHFQPRIARLPQVVVCFDLHIFDVPWKYHPHTKGLRRRFDRNMATSQAILTPFIRPFRKLPQLFEGIGDKLFYVHCPTLLGDIPLHQDILTEMRQRFALTHELPMLLYPATLQQHKNHKNLISALALLRKAGFDTMLICPGSEFQPDITRDIKQHAADLGMLDRVVFPGFMSSEEVRALYELCTAAISPSLAEGGNMIAQEAIAFGKPVACANTEPSREQIALMHAHVPLFDADDIATMSQTIRLLIQDSDTYVIANESARTHVANWTWAHVAQRLHEVFAWVAQSSPGSQRPALDIT